MSKLFATLLGAVVVGLAALAGVAGPAWAAGVPRPGYSDVGGGKLAPGFVGQAEPGGIVVDSTGGYYDPMTSQYYQAGTGPAAA